MRDRVSPKHFNKKSKTKKRSNNDKNNKLGPSLHTVVALFTRGKTRLKYILSEHVTRNYSLQNSRTRKMFLPNKNITVNHVYFAYNATKINCEKKQNTRRE